MNETLRMVIGVGTLGLMMFTIQSLPLLWERHTFYKILPLVMFLIPLQCIAETAWRHRSLWEAVAEYAVIFLPMIIGNILGWIVGLCFRKILDAERAAGDTETKDDS